MDKCPVENVQKKLNLLKKKYFRKLIKYIQICEAFQLMKKKHINNNLRAQIIRFGKQFFFDSGPQFLGEQIMIIERAGLNFCVRIDQL
jgi:hypothetical protein